MPSSTEKISEFRRLHEGGFFVLPNPWDIGSARTLEALGFKALASTSSGAAASLGKGDGELDLQEVLAHLRSLASATGLPLNADFEDGFHDSPEGVAANVSLAIETGIAGLSIEDRKGDALFELSHAVARVRAAREAIDSSGSGVLLIGRSEGFLVGRTDLNQTIDRLVAISRAGADCLYAPGVTDLAAVAAIVKAVAPKPVNVLLADGGMSPRDLAAIGVRRASTGGALARAAQSALVLAAKKLLNTENLETGARS